MNIPDLITVLRILLIPLFIGLLLYDSYAPAAVVFCCAGITDVLDGMLARKLGSFTRLGAYLDPMADKLLSVSSFVTLAVKGPIPAWFVLIVISRDVMISLGTLILYLSGGTLNIAPSMVGKVTTFFQFLTILATVVLLIDERILFFWKTVLYAAALLTVLSGGQYLYRGLVSRE